MIDGVLEVICRSNYCGKTSGVLVIHQFSVTTGELVATKKYRDPAG